MTQRPIYQTKLLEGNAATIEKASEWILKGETVALPTETVYGLAADATNKAAIAKIYEAKNRPIYNPLIVHVGAKFRTHGDLLRAGLVSNSDYSDKAIDRINVLIDNFWPGPLTIVLPRGPKLAREVAKGLDSVGFRMPDHEIFLQVLAKSDRPLAAPSANQANRISPTEADHVMQELAGRIPLILDGGAAKVGVESTILAVDKDAKMILLRHGGVALEDIELVTGILPSAGTHNKTKVQAPGMMAVHYAPRKPFYFIDVENHNTYCEGIKRTAKEHSVSILIIGLEKDGFFTSILKNFSKRQVQYIPADDKIVARKLFGLLREQDESDCDAIVLITKKYQKGLWPAIFDRLKRAAADSNLT